MDLFDELKTVQNNKYSFNEDTLNKLKQFNQIIIWGTGESAEVALDFLTNNNIKVDAFYDDDKAKQGKIFKTIPVIAPNYNVVPSDTALIIACSFYETIRNKLIVNNPNIDNNLFVFDGYFLEDITYEYFFKNKDKILKCYELLNDEKSKDLFINLLKYRYLRDINLLSGKYDNKNDTYFDKVFLDNFQQGLIVDAGSYNADFVTGLAERKDVSNCQFYIFEPNIELKSKIEINLKDKFNFKVFPIAVCDKKEMKAFSLVASTTGHLTDNEFNIYTYSKNQNIVKVPADKLDNIIKDEKVTVLKTDVEGAELALLKGATEMIINNRPALLLSAYHKCSDLWELLYYIDSLNLNYKFYLRHYAFYVAETVLYCIPENN